MVQSLKDPHTVAAIINTLRHVHGDAIARYMVTKGMTLAFLIDTLLRSPLKNSDAVKLLTGALRSGDFIITPEIVAASHLTYIYDPPKSLHVVDIAIETLDGTVVSADIRLRLRNSI
jgi:hypothetical protein